MLSASDRRLNGSYGVLLLMCAYTLVLLFFGFDEAFVFQGRNSEVQYGADQNFESFEVVDGLYVVGW